MKVNRIAEMNTEPNPMMLVCADATLNFHDNANRIVSEPVRASNNIGNEGNLNRCLYLRDSASVA